MQGPCTDLKDEFQAKISSGNNLLKHVSSYFNSVKGVEKLKKKIRQEILFLTKVMNSGLMKKEHLQCTNLHHFEAMVSCAVSEKECFSILETFTIQLEDGSSKRICVDIVSQGGRKWTKVIARNPSALSRISVGGGDFGQKTVIDKASEYVNCALQHLHHFRTPLVVFHFASGISSWLALELEKHGVTVTGERIEDEFVQSDGDSSDSSEEIGLMSNAIPNIKNDDIKSEVCKLNLDITTMIAYVSALTNGGSQHTFDEPLLNQQALWERLHPIKPHLDRLFEGKQLYCCATASKDFETIIATLGGAGEKERAAELMTRITIVPDFPFSPINIGGKIKTRSVAIFGTGHKLKALTVTANEGFVRAAMNQGIKFAVYIHESRALTEAKQKELHSS